MASDNAKKNDSLIWQTNKELLMSKTEEEASRRANIKKSYLGEPVDTKG
jgi:hypothetical protein